MQSDDDDLPPVFKRARGIMRRKRKVAPPPAGLPVLPETMPQGPAFFSVVQAALNRLATAKGVEVGVMQTCLLVECGQPRDRPIEIALMDKDVQKRAWGWLRGKTA